MSRIVHPPLAAPTLRMSRVRCVVQHMLNNRILKNRNYLLSFHSLSTPSDNETKMRCKICRNLIPSMARVNTEHKYTAEELRSSAESCETCTIIISALLSSSQDDVKEISMQDLHIGGYDISVAYNTERRSKHARFFNVSSTKPFSNGHTRQQTLCSPTQK